MLVQDNCDENVFVMQWEIPPQNSAPEDKMVQGKQKQETEAHLQLKKLDRIRRKIN